MRQTIPDHRQQLKTLTLDLIFLYRKIQLFLNYKKVNTVVFFETGIKGNV